MTQPKKRFNLAQPEKNQVWCGFNLAIFAILRQMSQISPFKVYGKYIA